jgi:hypothetical protein
MPGIGLRHAQILRDAGNGPVRGMSRWVHRIITRYHLQIHKNTSLRDVFPGG